MFAAGKTATVSGAGPDDKFNYVTMLLHGDGTNGAQNNTFLDSSTNNFSITRNGNTTQGSFSPYGSNWSNFFDGNTAYQSAPSNAAFAMGTGDFTIECWFFLTGSGNKALWGIGDGTTSGGVMFRVEPGASRFNFYNTTDIYFSGSSIANNTWYHVAVVRSSGTLSVYLNGSLYGSSVSNSTSISTNIFYIGCGKIGATVPYNPMDGYISNMRAVKGTAVYTGSFTPSTTPLTAISGTSLLICQSNRFIDNSSNNFTLTIGGSPSVQRFNPFGTSTAYSTSVIGGSGYFDGSGDYLTFSPSTSFAFGTGDFTIEFFMNTGGVNAGGAVLDSTTNGSYWAIRFSGTTLYYQSASGITNLATPTISTLSQSAWTHVALVRASGTTKIYANGVQVSSTADSTNYTATTTYQIAKSSDSSHYTGYFSDVRVVKGTAVYTAAFTPPTAPLTAITNTSLLTSYINGAIFDNAMMNDLETVGNAQISTSVVKYGTGSLYFDGTGDWLTSPDIPSLEFGSGNFTLECWINTTVSNSGYVSAISKWGTSNQSWMIRAASADIGSGWSFFYSDDGSSYYTVFGSSINDGNWHHLAVTRSGNVFRTFTDGTLNNSATAAVTLFDGTASLFVGAQSGGANPFTGYIDDLRITKGYARYTATFTPPTAAFSDTGPY